MSVNLSVVNNNQWLATAEQALRQAGGQSARLDSLLLLEHVSGQDRARILAYPENLLDQIQLDTLQSLLQRRLQHEPMAYILGRVEFYGRQFTTDKNVLVPRPESEDLIGLTKELIGQGHDWTIIDLGTGSGALAITTKLEIPSANVIATDIDQACLNIAKANAALHQATLAFYRSDLLQALPDSVFDQPYVILANLPYVPENYPLNASAQHEPELAIFSGQDGLDHYRQLFSQLAAASHERSTYLICESLDFQQPKLIKLAVRFGYRLQASRGLQLAFAS